MTITKEIQLLLTAYSEKLEINNDNKNSQAKLVLITLGKDFPNIFNKENMIIIQRETQKHFNTDYNFIDFIEEENSNTLSLKEEISILLKSYTNISSINKDFPQIFNLSNLDLIFNLLPKENLNFQNLSKKDLEEILIA